MTYEDLYKFTSQFYNTTLKKLRKTNYKPAEIAELKGKKNALEFLMKYFSEYHAYGNIHTMLVYKLEEVQEHLDAATAEEKTLLQNILKGENETYKYFLILVDKERQPQKPRRPYRYPRLYRRE